MIKFNEYTIKRFTALLLILLFVTGCSAEVNQDQISSDSIAGSEVSENQTADQPEEQLDTLSENAGQSMPSDFAQTQELSENEVQEEDEGTYDTMKEVQLIIDNNIALDDLFVQFIAGDAKAYSYGNEEEKYISDYYEEYSADVNVVRLMAEDLNGDGENELLINMNGENNEGIILAFHSQDGNLFEWESISYGMHSPEVSLYPDVNTIEITGTGWTRVFFTYNSHGEQELIFSCSSIGDDLENGNFRRQYFIVEYQDGIEQEKYSMEEISDEYNNLVFESSEEERLLFDRVLNDFLSTLGEGKQININTRQNDVEVTDTVTFDELINGIVVQ